MNIRLQILNLLPSKTLHYLAHALRGLKSARGLRILIGCVLEARRDLERRHDILFRTAAVREACTSFHSWPSAGGVA